MVYVSKDGQVLQSISLPKKIFGFFTGIIYMVILFFRTMVNPDMNKYGNSRNYGAGSGSQSPRRLGRPNTRDNVNIPFGGCSSCAR
ncbi:selenoprotein K [Megalopta genalis]|uniref:selenoprotein K n=1 Tax=Megalopta genalis TaxID=115081 RepID=UPI001442EFFE|nr:selenoprotein K-like [Megalopta genalis]